MPIYTYDVTRSAKCNG